MSNFFTRATKQIAIVAGVLGAGALVGAPAIANNHTTATPQTQPGQPTQVQQQPGRGTTAPGRWDASAQGNLVEVASQRDSFNTLLQAAEAAGLDNQLAQQGPYTIFAPTDAAFNELPAGAVELLTRPENRDLLQQVLTYHVVSGEVTSDQISTGPVETLGGGVSVRVADDRVIINDASVVEADIQATNGVIHAVNRVLMPRELRNTIVSRLDAQPNQNVQ